VPGILVGFFEGLRNVEAATQVVGDRASKSFGLECAQVINTVAQLALSGREAQQQHTVEEQPSVTLAPGFCVRLRRKRKLQVAFFYVIGVSRQSTTALAVGE